MTVEITARPTRDHSVHLHIAMLAAAWIALTAQPLAAQSSGSDSAALDWDRASLTCEPSCRKGYTCTRGECTPVCSPACAGGALCSEDGVCVEPEPAVVVAAPGWQPSTNACEPACRTGYTCLAGRCASLCNPVCPASEVCTANGECMPMQLDDARPVPERVAQPGHERDESADAIVNLHLDVAGAVQFGIAPAVEIGKVVSGYLRLRVVNAGLLSYFLLGRDSSDYLRAGVGVALGLHLFSAERGNMRGVYGGLALEYAFLEMRDSSRDFAIYRTHALIPQLDVGYRWAFGSLLVGVAVGFGFAIPIENSARPLGNMGCRRLNSCIEDFGASFIPGVTVDLGWFIEP